MLSPHTILPVSACISLLLYCTWQCIFPPVYVFTLAACVYVLLYLFVYLSNLHLHLSSTSVCVSILYLLDYLFSCICLCISLPRSVCVSSPASVCVSSPVSAKVSFLLYQSVYLSSSICMIISLPSSVFLPILSIWPCISVTVCVSVSCICSASVSHTRRGWQAGGRVKCGAGSVERIHHKYLTISSNSSQLLFFIFHSCKPKHSLRALLPHTELNPSQPVVFLSFFSCVFILTARINAIASKF